MKRDVVIKCCSCLLTVWYILCMAGLDVHTCKASGNVFFSLAVEKLQSENAGFCHACPDSYRECCCGCHGCHSCSQSEFADSQNDAGNFTLFSGKCCSDDFISFIPNGIDRIGQEHSHHHHCTCICGHCPVLADFYCILAVPDESGFRRSFSDCSVKGFLPDDILSVFSVWRI